MSASGWGPGKGQLGRMIHPHPSPPCSGAKNTLKPVCFESTFIDAKCKGVWDEGAPSAAPPLRWIVFWAGASQATAGTFL